MRLLKLFLSNDRGAVALMFALVLIPLMGLAGAAIDYGRAANQLSRLQSAVDMTALNLAKLPETVSAANLQTQADTAIRSMIQDPNVRTALNIGATRTGSLVQVTASSRVATAVVSIVGIYNFPISASSTAEWGSTRLRVALALDVTGSMASSGKLAAMKTAATNLINQLQNAATNTGDVYVSIVPLRRM